MHALSCVWMLALLGRPEARGASVQHRPYSCTHTVLLHIQNCCPHWLQVLRRALPECVVEQP